MARVSRATGARGTIAMPIIMKGQKRVIKTWQQVIQDQFRECKVLPLISNAVGNDLVLRGHKQLIEEYATYLDYPLDDKYNLPNVTQRASVMHEVSPGEAVIRR